MLPLPERYVGHCVGGGLQTATACYVHGATCGQKMAAAPPGTASRAPRERSLQQLAMPAQALCMLHLSSICWCCADAICRTAAARSMSSACHAARTHSTPQQTSAASAERRTGVAYIAHLLHAGVHHFTRIGGCCNAGLTRVTGRPRSSFVAISAGRPASQRCMRMHTSAHTITASLQQVSTHALNTAASSPWFGSPRGCMHTCRLCCAAAKGSQPQRRPRRPSCHPSRWWCWARQGSRAHRCARPPVGGAQQSI